MIIAAAVWWYALELSSPLAVSIVAAILVLLPAAGMAALLTYAHHLQSAIPQVCGMD